jgi:hypothetical protein
MLSRAIRVFKTSMQKERRVFAFATFIRYGSASELASWNPDSRLKSA